MALPGLRALELEDVEVGGISCSSSSASDMKLLDCPLQAPSAQGLWHPAVKGLDLKGKYKLNL